MINSEFNPKGFNKKKKEILQQVEVMKENGH
jgi:hypothetical protein